MAGQFLKGGLVSFMPTFIGAVPNVTIFQINPETITHSWTPAAPAKEAQSGADPLAVKGVPGETFGFTLFMDANDEIANGTTNPVAAGLASATGLYTRLAALEMLQYPLASAGAGLLGTVSASVSASGASLSASVTAASDASVPRMQVPVVLFVWGPQRIVPVRVTALTINEKLYDTSLNPTHAEVQITLRVLTPDELGSKEGILGPMRQVANIAYVYTQGLRQVHAAANLADSAVSILGMLPTPF
jgi:hypothetical protein